MPDRQSHIRLRRLVTAVVGALAVAVTGAGLAWACTPRAELDGLDPASGPPGTQVKVRGKYFPETSPRRDTNGHVKIFLDSEEGRVLGEGPTDKWGCFPAGCKGTETAWGPHTTITIPPGLSLGSRHKIIAVGYENPRGALPVYNERTRKSPRGLTTLEKPFVVEPAPRRDSDTPGDTTPGKTKTPPAPTKTPSAVPRAGGSPATSRSATSNRPTTDGSDSRGTAPASRAGSPAPNGGAPGAPIESSNPGLVTAPSGQSLFEDSMPPAALTDARRFGQPSGRSASGDLWSGFGSGKTPSLEPRRSDDPAAEEAGGFDLGLAAGTGFLGLGLAALFGSFLVAEVRRRRKAVRA